MEYIRQIENDEMVLNCEAWRMQLLDFETIKDDINDSMNNL